MKLVYNRLMIRMLSRTTSYRKQNGFISIIASLLIMVILSLITIGFTRIMQREQRQVLDRQLSRQAIYAAESGINDIYSALVSNTNLPAEKTICDVSSPIINGQPNPSVNIGKISESGDIAYTCALYDKTPPELVYSINTNESKIINLSSESGSKISTLNISWANEQGDNNITSLPTCGTASATVFPGSRSSNVPLIRLDITNTATLSRESLINGTDYLYLAPCNAGSLTTTHTYSVSPKGQIIQVSCLVSQNMPCTLTVDGLSSASYIARIKPIYGSAKVIISGKDNAGNSVEFMQAQTSIDVTAKANDVVRRLKVSMPFANIDSAPEAVVHSFDSICKLMTVDAGSNPATTTDSCL